MAEDASHGLRGALGLDQAADDLNRSRAAAAEKAAKAAAAELPGLFADRSVFGTLKLDDAGKTETRGPGRPRGSLNRRTAALAEYAARLGGNPILKMIEIVATPIDVIARTFDCKRIEAAEYHRKVCSDLGSYIEQRLPTAIQLTGANAGMLVVNLGGPVGAQATGLDMRLVSANIAEADRIIEHEQNQALSEGEADASHDEPSHREAK